MIIRLTGGMAAGRPGGGLLMAMALAMATAIGQVGLRSAGVVHDGLLWWEVSFSLGEVVLMVFHAV